MAPMEIAMLELRGYDGQDEVAKLKERIKMALDQAGIAGVSIGIDGSMCTELGEEPNPHILMLCRGNSTLKKIIEALLAGEVQEDIKAITDVVFVTKETLRSGSWAEMI